MPFLVEMVGLDLEQGSGSEFFSSSLAVSLKEQILSREATVGVVGLGYVGLALGAAFAEAGFHVLGFDIDVERVELVNGGCSHIPDVPSARLRKLVNEGRFRATAD